MDHQSIWDPPVKISTPEVLRRIKSEKGGALRFSSGNYGLLSISIWYLPKPPRQQGEGAPSNEDQQAQQKEKIQN